MTIIIGIGSIFLLTALQAFADPSFTGITNSDFDSITKEMSANFAHSSNLGPSKMGIIFGVQVGLIAAQTGTPNTDAIVKRSGGSGLPNLYNAGLLGAVGIPMGIAFEAVIIPKLTASGSSLNSTSFAVKWNINEVVPVLPVNLALRGFYSNAAFEFGQTVATIPVTVSSKTKVTGLQLLISPMLPLVEPYLGIGLLSGTTELGVTGAISIFDPAYSTAQSETKTASATQMIAGIDVNLLIMKIGAEFTQSFGASRTAVKLAFGF